jgi:phosphatidylglycerophosphate synthase
MNQTTQLHNLLEQLKLLPNQLTATRLLLIPILWMFAWLKLPIYIGIGVFICFITDVLDGYFARKLHLESDFGSQFDSLADHLLLPSGLIWMWLFCSKIYTENIVLCLITLLIYFGGLLLGALRFRRFANLHLISGKISAVLVYLFLSYTLIVGTYNHLFFYLACGTFLVARSESLMLQMIASRVNAHARSILFLGRGR